MKSANQGKQKKVFFQMSFKRRMVHLSMVSDGFDAVVHDALLSSMVRGGDGRGGVCDDPFLHPHTLVGHHDYDQNQWQ